MMIAFVRIAYDQSRREEMGGLECGGVRCIVWPLHEISCDEHHIHFGARQDKSFSWLWTQQRNPGRSPVSSNHANTHAHTFHPTCAHSPACSYPARGDLWVTLNLVHTHTHLLPLARVLQSGGGVSQYIFDTPQNHISPSSFFAPNMMPRSNVPFPACCLLRVACMFVSKVTVQSAHCLSFRFSRLTDERALL